MNVRFDILTREIFIGRSYCKFIICYSLFGLLANFELYLEVCGWENEICYGAVKLPQGSVCCLKYALFLVYFPAVSWHFPCLFHVHFRAENFEPYLSQVLKIRWEDELGRKNPLTDKEYRYFILLFCVIVGRLARPLLICRGPCGLQGCIVFGSEIRFDVFFCIPYARFHFV